ncbi:DMT family transporter [Campylobacter iguaniorum]|uniref:DMT family transporter n=1 Tax=Campylobacter iguaniorum TaxID=1244531 RepID=UPI0009E928C3
MTIKKISLIFIAIIGVILLFGSADYKSSNLLGEILAICSAIFYSIYLLTMFELRKYMSSRSIVFYNAIITAIILLPIAFIYDMDILPNTLNSFLAIIALAIFTQILGHGSMTYALKYINATLASTTSLARPIVSILLGYIILNQNITFNQIIGAMIILSSIYFYYKNNSFKK